MIVVFKLVFLLFHFFAVAPAGVRWPLLATLCIAAVVGVMWRLRRQSSKPPAPSGPRPLPGADPRASARQ
jgi:hypothetical protein